MSMEDFLLIKQQAIPIIQQAADFIRDEFGKITSKNIEVKSLNSLVTYVDKEAEKILVEDLKEVLPKAAFLTEEETIQRTESDYQWIIDPLDGTTNFIHGIPVFAVSVALKYKNKIVMGIVHDVMQDNCFHAAENEGAFLNNNKIDVSQTPSLSDSLIATGFPYYDFEYLDNYQIILKKLMNSTRGIRRLGAAAIDLAYVACGKFDAYFEYSLSPWDVAAGALIVQEAGGVISDFSGNSNWLFGKEVVASNKLIAAPFLEEVQKAFIR